MRLNNPQTIDEEALAIAIDRDRIVPVVQFSEPSAYDGAALAQLNRACQRFGPKIHVRFYGHYGGEFDCQWLRFIPDVRSLGIDCLMRAVNVGELNELCNLEELTFGVFEADLPEFLEMPSLSGLRKLILVDNRRNNIDLAPLATFGRLDSLVVCGHVRNIQGLGRAVGIRTLALNQIGKSVRIDFVRAMAGLKSLSIMLGGRPNLDDVTHEHLQHLAVMRVRGLEKIDLRGLRRLTLLHVEDQLQMRTLDVEPIRAQLRHLKIWNCKQLNELLGIQLLDQLEYLWLGRTSIDPERLLEVLPRTLRSASLSGYGTKRDLTLKGRLRSLGFAEASYMEQTASD